MADEAVESSVELHQKNMQVSADEAKEKSARYRRRSVEVTSSFSDKLSALDAGSIAVTVSVGIAMLGRPEARFGSMHSHLSWLLWIAGLLWLSLICSVGHNFTMVRVARLEAEEAEKYARYLALVSASQGASERVKEMAVNHILDTLAHRIKTAAVVATRIAKGENRGTFLRQNRRFDLPDGIHVGHDRGDSRLVDNPVISCRQL